MNIANPAKNVLRVTYLGKRNEILISEIDEVVSSHVAFYIPTEEYTVDSRVEEDTELEEVHILYSINFRIDSMSAALLKEAIEIDLPHVQCNMELIGYNNN